MCAIQPEIERTVGSLIANRTPFTAYNVTQILRNLNIGLNERHSAIRSVVHKLFDTGQMDDYQQDQVTLPTNGRDRAFVFYPPGVDPNDAQVLQNILNAHGAAATAVATAQAQPQVLPVLTAAHVLNAHGAAAASAPAKTHRSSRTNASKTIKTNGTSALKSMGTLPGSTLYIPKVMAHALGIPNSSAVVKIDPTNCKISILPSGSNPGAGKKACVDRNHNIRIGKTALLAAGLNGQIKVELDGQKIEISKG